MMYTILSRRWKKLCRWQRKKKDKSVAAEEKKKKTDPFLEGFNMFANEEKKEKSHLDSVNSGGKSKNAYIMPQGSWARSLSGENPIQKAVRENAENRKEVPQKKVDEKRTQQRQTETSTKKKTDPFLEGFNLFAEEEKEEKNHLDFVRSGGKTNQNQEEKYSGNSDIFYPELRLQLSGSHRENSQKLGSFWNTSKVKAEMPEKSNGNAAFESESANPKYGGVGKLLLDRWEQAKSRDFSKERDIFNGEPPELTWGKGEKNYIKNAKNSAITPIFSLNPIENVERWKNMPKVSTEGLPKLDFGLDTLENILSIGEWLPGIGDIAGLGTAAVNIAQGDWDEAILDGIGMIPIAGDVTSKAIDVGKGAKKVSKTLGAVDDAIDLGRAADKIDDAYDVAKVTQRDELLSQTTNAKLQNTIKEMYRPNATVGDGGLSDAVRYELRAGKFVGGRSHIQKAKERLSNIKNILKRETLDTVDEKIIRDLVEDLENALEGEII